MPSVRSLLGIGALIVVMSILAFPFYVMNGHPVSIGALSFITTSSTQDDVTALIGKPSKIDSNGSVVAWQYTGFTWCMVTVTFDPDGNVQSVDHDH